jgi:hypothetical protein
MVMLNGSAPHMHAITDFTMTGTPITKGTATAYNGTATRLDINMGKCFDSGSR